MTKMIVGHEIWLSKAKLDSNQAVMALFYGDLMCPDGSPDPNRLDFMVYRPDGSIMKPSVLSDNDLHIIKFPCAEEGCYTVIVDMKPIIATQTKDGWHVGPKTQFKDPIDSRIVGQMAKKILLAGDGQLENEEPLHGILEIVPDKVNVRKGEVAGLRVFYEGKPLAGAKLKAVSGKEKREMVQTNTDDQGRANIPLTVEGDWMFVASYRDYTKKSEEFDMSGFVTTLGMEAR